MTKTFIWGFIFLILMGFQVEAQKIKQKNTKVQEKTAPEETRWEDSNDDYYKRFDATTPEFLGGAECLNCYLSNVIQYPDSAREAGICGTVLVEFVVEKDGGVKTVTVKSGMHRLLDAEAVRGVKSTSGYWKPGTAMGKPVRIYFQVPITFQCPEKEDISSSSLCYCDIRESYQPPVAFQNEDTLMIPLQFDLAKKHLRTEDSLMLTSILHKFNAAEDVEAHLWIYEYYMEEKSEYLSPKRSEYINHLLHKEASARSVLLFAHTEMIEDIERWQELNQSNSNNYLVLIRKR